jgi:hypothetical protein
VITLVNGTHAQSSRDYFLTLMRAMQAFDAISKGQFDQCWSLTDVRVIERAKIDTCTWARQPTAGSEFKHPGNRRGETENECGAGGPTYTLVKTSAKFPQDSRACSQSTRSLLRMRTITYKMAL